MEICIVQSNLIVVTDVLAIYLWVGEHLLRLAYRGENALSAKRVHDAGVVRHFRWWLKSPMRERHTRLHSTQVQVDASVGGGSS